MKGGKRAFLKVLKCRSVNHTYIGISSSLLSGEKAL